MLLNNCRTKLSSKISVAKCCLKIVRKSVVENNRTKVLLKIAARNVRQNNA